MRAVHGTARHYDWGDTTFIPDLLGLPADGRPWAEWWVGTHPSAPSTLDDGSPLAATTGSLPWLLKVLSAAQPLSMQTHPDAEAARRGFQTGVFSDPNPKPELLVALTSFSALCGVRPIDATVALALGHQQQCDEVTRDDEEHLDAEETARQPRRIGVIDHHRDHRERAQTVEPRQVGHAADRHPAGTLDVGRRGHGLPVSPRGGPIGRQ